jgi:hypothetical protein
VQTVTKLPRKMRLALFFAHCYFGYITAEDLFDAFDVFGDPLPSKSAAWQILARLAGLGYLDRTPHRGEFTTVFVKD